MNTLAVPRCPFCGAPLEQCTSAPARCDGYAIWATRFMCDGPLGNGPPLTPDGPGKSEMLREYGRIGDFPATT